MSCVLWERSGGSAVQLQRDAALEEAGGFLTNGLYKLLQVTKLS